MGPRGIELQKRVGKALGRSMCCRVDWQLDAIVYLRIVDQAKSASAACAIGFTEWEQF